MIEAWIHEPKADDGPLEEVACLAQRGVLGADAVPGEQGRVDQREVTFTLVDAKSRRRRETLALEPFPVPALLRASFGMAEPRRQHAPREREPAVGREHHVGQPGHGIHQPHLVPERPVHLHEPLPLAERAGPVDRDRRVHPRIDGVDDVEVLRRAHEECAPPCPPGGLPVHPELGCHIEHDMAAPHAAQ